MKLDFIQINPVTYFVCFVSFGGGRFEMFMPKKRQNVYGFLNKAFKITAKVIGKLFKSSTRQKMFWFRAGTTLWPVRFRVVCDSVIRRQLWVFAPQKYDFISWKKTADVFWRPKNEFLFNPCYDLTFKLKKRKKSKKNWHRS